MTLPAGPPQARPASEDDLGALVGLYQECLAELAVSRGGPVLAGQGRGTVRADIERSFLDQLGSPSAMLSVATDEGAVVGYLSASRYELDDGSPLARVGELFVSGACRRRGAGRALAAQLLDWAEGQGCVGVDAHALPGSRAAKSFFEGHGFTARLLVMHRRLA